jgi:hypothetical protein
MQQASSSEDMAYQSQDMLWP